MVMFSIRKGFVTVDIIKSHNKILHGYIIKQNKRQMLAGEGNYTFIAIY